MFGRLHRLMVDVYCLQHPEHSMSANRAPYVRVLTALSALIGQGVRDGGSQSLDKIDVRFSNLGGLGNVQSTKQFMSCVFTLLNRLTIAQHDL